MTACTLIAVIWRGDYFHLLTTCQTRCDVGQINSYGSDRRWILLPKLHTHQFTELLTTYEGEQIVSCYYPATSLTSPCTYISSILYRKCIISMIIFSFQFLNQCFLDKWNIPWYINCSYMLLSLSIYVQYLIIAIK